MDKLNATNSKPTFRGVADQFSKLVPIMALVYLPLLCGFAVLIGVYFVADIPLRVFFIDPVAEFNAPMYVGLLSNFGVLLWGAAAAVCLFAGWLMRNASDNRDSALFLTAAGLFSGILMLDDLYLIHEEVIEDHLYIHQKYVFALYGLLLMGLLVRFRKLILNSDYLLLFFGFVFLAISLAIDLWVTPEDFVIFGRLPGRHILEDGMKLLGIASWTAYFVRTSAQSVKPLIRST